jgi:hypothetical protein
VVAVFAPLILAIYTSGEKRECQTSFLLVLVCIHQTDVVLVVLVLELVLVLVVLVLVVAVLVVVVVVVE